MSDVLWTTEQIAEWLGVDPATVRRYRRMGMPAIVLPGGQTVRFRRPEVDEWLASLRDPVTLDDLAEVSR